jgi:hypothetical protein
MTAAKKDHTILMPKQRSTKMKRSLKVGDFVEILPQHRDVGDEDVCWLVIAPEEKGRVTIRAENTGLSIKPQYVVRSEWVRLRST